jgi:hypothetical protein
VLQYFPAQSLIYVCLSLGCQEGQWLSLDFFEEKTLLTFTIEWTVDPSFAHEVRKMFYDILEHGQTWVNAVVQSHTDIVNISGSTDNSVTLLVRLDLGSPKTFTGVRIAVGSGSQERSPWEVFGCIVRS